MGRREFQEKYKVAINCEGDDNEQVMKLARNELPGYFEETLKADNEELYSQARFDLEMSQLTSERFPEENFDVLFDTIKDPRFLKSSYGWTLFSIFNDDWEKLSEAQKIRLLELLTEVYERFDDWMPCFSISELVGEKFPAGVAFKFFNGFRKSSNETSRLFVPHGYEHSMQTSTDKILTSKIWSALLDMEQDESQKVRNEVKESLDRLANRGIEHP